MTWLTKTSWISALLCAAACNPDSPMGAGDGSDTGDETATSAGETTVGEPTDGDSSEPQAPANIIFVTSTLHDGALGGLAGADAVCNERAAAAGLPGEYVAWLSTTEVHAIDRVIGARGWLRPDGRPFADDRRSLLGPNWYPPTLDEFGQVVPDDTTTLTGTNFMGMFFHEFGSCADWTSSAGIGDNGGVGTGVPFEGGAGWSSGGAAGCDVPHRLMCLGVDLDVPVALPAAEGRLAFVSKSGVIDGLASADEQCQAEATLNELPGSYLALLATTNATAASRFDLGGPTWFRIDGAQLFESAADLPEGRPLAPLARQANGTAATSLVRLGAPTPGSASDGSCEDWAGTTGEARGGRSARVGALAYGGMSHPCADELAIYCLQE